MPQTAYIPGPGFFQISLQLRSVLVCLVLDERNARSFNFEDDNGDEAEDKMVSIAITGAQTKRDSLMKRTRNITKNRCRSKECQLVACSTEYGGQFFSIPSLSNFSLYLLAFLIIVNSFYVIFFMFYLNNNNNLLMCKIREIIYITKIK